MHGVRIAAVIPAWNEARGIGELIAAVAASASPVGIIVGDCASDDGTQKEAEQAGATVVDTPPPASRAAALNVGVEYALSRFADVQAIWIVHADVTPPADAGSHVRETLSHEMRVGGAFRFAFDTRGLQTPARIKLGVVTLLNRLRYRLTGVYFGDQGIFFKASAWQRVGPLPEWPLMEDAELSRRLARLGKLTLVPVPMFVSPRRFLRHGPLRQLAIDMTLITLHRLGVPPSRLSRIAAWYNREKS